MEMPGIKTQSVEQKWKKQRGFKFQISSLYVLGPKVQPRVLHSVGPLLWLTQLQCQRRWSQWTLRRGSEGWQWAWWDGEAGELRGSCSWRSSHRPPPSGLLQAPPIAWRCTAVECLISSKVSSTCSSTWDCWRVGSCTLGKPWELGCFCTPRRLCDPRGTGNGKMLTVEGPSVWAICQI